MQVWGECYNVWTDSSPWAPGGWIEGVASGHDGNDDGVLDPANSADFLNSRYQYTFDDAGRRQWERSDGFIYGRYLGGMLSTKFDYDHLGQLKSAKTYQGPGTNESAPRVPG